MDWLGFSSKRVSERGRYSAAASDGICHLLTLRDKSEAAKQPLDLRIPQSCPCSLRDTRIPC